MQQWILGDGARRPARPRPGAEELQPAAARPQRPRGPDGQRHRAATSSPAAPPACPRPRASPTCAPSSTCAASPARRAPGPTTASTCALPLYHATGGLCAHGRGAAERRLGGAAQRKFSASHFWDEVGRRGLHHVRLHRRALPLPGQPAAAAEDERAHKMRLAFGNGLRPDVWPS